MQQEAHLIAIAVKTFLTLLALAVIAVGVAACAPLRTINALTPTSTYDRTAGIPYGSDPRQRLDVYTPRGGAFAHPAPVVVFFFGGNWNSGNRADYAFVGEALASRGIVAVIADYRLYPQVRYPAFLEDCALAVAWAADHAQQYSGDPARLYVMGHSAGAYNAAMIALDSRWLAAAHPAPIALRGWIGLAGPYDFIPIQNPDTRPVFFYPDTPPDSQPINHVTRGAPPALLIASTHDTLVNPVRNTGGLAQRLRAAGVHVEQVDYEKTSHTTLIAAMWWPMRGLADVLDKTAAFIASDGGRAPPARQPAI